MKAILVSTDMEKKQVTVKVVDFENKLESYYEKIKCSCIDMVRFDSTFWAIVDDEGLLKSGNIVLEYCSQSVFYQLAGDILICADDEQNIGEMRGLTEQEIALFRDTYSITPIGFTR